MTIYTNIPRDSKATLHKFFKYDFSKPKKYIEPILPANLKTLVIDEISMVIPELFPFLVQVKQRGIRIICVGDFGQLPPVGYEHIDFENSLVYKQICDGNRITLTEVYRSSDMGEIYNEVRATGEVDLPRINYEESLNTSELHLCYTNKMRHKINRRLMANHIKGLPKDEYMHIHKYGRDEFDGEPIKAVGVDPLTRGGKHQITPFMEVYAGMPIIVHKATTQHCKNMRGVVDRVDVKTEQIFLRIGEDIVETNVDNFNLTYDCGYSITVHKSQGLTITIPYCIHEWDIIHPFLSQYTRMSQATVDSFVKKWKYVAVSRTSSKKLLNIVE